MLEVVGQEVLPPPDVDAPWPWTWIALAFLVAFAVYFAWVAWGRRVSRPP